MNVFDDICRGRGYDSKKLALHAVTSVSNSTASSRKSLVSWRASVPLQQLSLATKPHSIELMSFSGCRSYVPEDEEQSFAAKAAMSLAFGGTSHAISWSSRHVLQRCMRCHKSNDKAVTHIVSFDLYSGANRSGRRMGADGTQPSAKAVEPP